MLTALRKTGGLVARAARAVVGAIRFVNPIGTGSGAIADREAMFGNEPGNDPRRMDFDPDRPVHRPR